MRVLPVQALHGIRSSSSSPSRCPYYINREVPLELRASGQTLNGLINLGAARIIGSYAGGYASQALGLKNVFLYSSILSFACLAAFALLARKSLGAKSLAKGESGDPKTKKGLHL